MKLTFLGSGAAFTVGADNYQSNILLSSSRGKHFLIDCGTDIRFSLYEKNLTSTDIDAVFVSHLHADHVGGVEWFALTNYFGDKPNKPEMFIQEQLHHPIWDNTLSGGLSSIEGVAATLDTFFQVQVVKDNFVWEGVEFQIVQTLHALNNKQYMPSFGLFLKYKNTKIFLTLDTKFTYELFKSFYNQADIIFHDCEISAKKTTVHAHYDDLRNLTPELKAKMWLYDYTPANLPNAVNDGFKGFVLKGQEFEFEEL